LARSAVLKEQLDYYRARAGEYDDWFFRRGRYDRGPELNSLWRDDVEQVKAALDRFGPRGRVLEMACGTGTWTGQLLQRAESVTAVDASPEMLAINAARLGDAKIDYVCADLFRWRPQERYDVIFFAFWLSHVPLRCFAPFWKMVAGGLAPGGRVFFVDSLHEETSAAKDHVLPEPRAETAVRRLNDGREFRIVKVFHEPDDLERHLRRLGWGVEVGRTARYFVQGHGGMS